MTRHAARVQRTLTAAAVCVLAFALYAADVPDNPPGFYIDESSIAYNAHTISESGRDEYGEAWPLYFRAFGDYKNPTYVYLLAAVFRVTGPSVAVARLLSASLGAVAALLLGLLAARVTRQNGGVRGRRLLGAADAVALRVEPSRLRGRGVPFCMRALSARAVARGVEGALEGLRRARRLPRRSRCSPTRTQSGDCSRRSWPRGWRSSSRGATSRASRLSGARTR